MSEATTSTESTVSPLTPVSGENYYHYDFAKEIDGISYPVCMNDASFLNASQLKELNSAVLALASDGKDGTPTSFAEVVYEESKVYSTVEKENKVVSSVRQSERFAVPYSEASQSLFSWIRSNVINVLNERTEQPVRFALCNDELVVLRYEEGSFFGIHNDFVTTVSNVAKCYSLMICLDATCTEGGETIVYQDRTTNPQGVAFVESRTPGGMLMFRFEVPHEGARVGNGHKVVLKCNVLGFRTQKAQKQQTDTDGLDDNADQRVVMMRFADTDSRYVFPLRLLAPYSDTLFHSVADTSNQDDVVLVVPIKMWTFAQCKPVYEFLLDPAGQFDAYRKNRELFDYFNIVHSGLESVRSGMQSVADRAFNDICNRMTVLLSNGEAKEGGDSVLLANDVDEYVRMKRMLRDVDGIVPFQCILCDGNGVWDKTAFNKVLWLSVYNGRCVWLRQRPERQIFHTGSYSDNEENENKMERVDLKDCYDEQTGCIHATVEYGRDSGYEPYLFLQTRKPKQMRVNPAQSQVSYEVEACMRMMTQASDAQPEFESESNVDDSTLNGFPSEGDACIAVPERVQINENHMLAMIRTTKNAERKCTATYDVTYSYHCNEMNVATVTSFLGFGFLRVKHDDIQ